LNAENMNNLICIIIEHHGPAEVKIHLVSCAGKKNTQLSTKILHPLIQTRVRIEH